MNDQTEKEERKSSFLKRINFTRSCCGYKLPTIKNWIITLIGFTLFCLAINGFIENKFGQFIGIEKILTESMLFLKESLLISLQHFASLSIIKGLTAAISDSTVFGLAAGKLISPISETVNFLFKLFFYSMASITAQMAILNFSTLISKYIFIVGTLLLDVMRASFLILDKPPNKYKPKRFITTQDIEKIIKESNSIDELIDIVINRNLSPDMAPW